MIKTVIVSDNGKLARILQFEVPTEDFDLKQAIHEACVEYCKTEEGWAKYAASEVFDVNSFVKYVPDMICKKYNFRRVRKPGVCIFMECCDRILTKQDEEKCRQYLEIKKVEKYNTCEVTAWFARIWGVMETLGNLPQQDFRKTADILVSWAEEFVEKGESDPIMFFQQKIGIWRKKERDEVLCKLWK